MTEQTMISREQIAMVLYSQHQTSRDRLPGEIRAELLRDWQSSDVPGVSIHEYYLSRADQIITKLASLGLVIVPKDPTEAMIQAGGYSARDYDEGFIYDGEEVAERTWRTMIAASTGKFSEPYDAYYAATSPALTTDKQGK